jgi:putative addiction module antidote
MSALKIQKVGNSLGVLFPKEILDALNITEGDIIEADIIHKNKVILETHLPHHSKWKFNDNELTSEDIEWIDADLEEEDDYARR